MKLLILDRDGVINHDSDAYIKSVAEWIPIPGSIEAIAALSKAGWTVAVATNQSGIARGYYDLATLEAMHAQLRMRVAEQGGEVGLIVYCPHGPDAGCDCRKPLPGLFEQIGARFGVPLKGVPTAGDSLRDLQAGAAAGCEPHLVLTGKSARYCSGGRPEGLPEGTQLHTDLSAFADFILERSARPLQVAL